MSGGVAYKKVVGGKLSFKGGSKLKSK